MIAPDHDRTSSDQEIGRFVTVREDVAFKVDRLECEMARQKRQSCQLTCQGHQCWQQAGYGVRNGEKNKQCSLV